MRKIPIKTWECSNCEYRQDFEPTTESMGVHFPNILWNKCPACGKLDSLVLKAESEAKITITIMEAGDKITDGDKERVLKASDVMTKNEVNEKFGKQLYKPI